MVIPNGPVLRVTVRSDVRDVVAGVEEGADLAVEDPRVGGVMHDRADDDAHRVPPRQTLKRVYGFSGNLATGVEQQVRLRRDVREVVVGVRLQQDRQVGGGGGRG